MSEEWLRKEARRTFRAAYGLSSEVRHAGFWIRVSAESIDSIVLMLIALATNRIPGSEGAGRAFMINLFVALVYYTVFSASPWQATPGKRFRGIHLITVDGGKVTVARAFARFWALLLSGALLAIGYLMVAFTNEKKGLHDILCGTRVVYGRT